MATNGRSLPAAVRTAAVPVWKQTIGQFPNVFPAGLSPSVCGRQLIP